MLSLLKKGDNLTSQLTWCWNCLRNQWCQFYYMDVKSGDLRTYRHHWRIHLKFCKIILNVKKFTENYMVYGELGRYPLRVLIYSRLIKFWAKIITPSKINKISFILYQIQLNQLNKGKKKCKWLGFVKSTLEKLGFNEVGNHNNSQMLAGCTGV